MIPLFAKSDPDFELSLPEIGLNVRPPKIEATVGIGALGNGSLAALATPCDQSGTYVQSALRRRET